MQGAKLSGPKFMQDYIGYSLGLHVPSSTSYLTSSVCTSVFYILSGNQNIILIIPRTEDHSCGVAQRSLPLKRDAMLLLLARTSSDEGYFSGRYLLQPVCAQSFSENTKLGCSEVSCSWSEDVAIRAIRSTGFLIF